MRAASRQSRANHRDKLLHTGLRHILLDLHALLLGSHSLHQMPADLSSFGHLATHEDDQLVGGLAGAFVGFFGAEDGFGDEGGKVVKRGRGEEGNESREKDGAVLQMNEISYRSPTRERREMLTLLAPLATLPALSTNFSMTSPTLPSITFPSLSSANLLKIL